MQASYVTLHTVWLRLQQLQKIARAQLSRLLGEWHKIFTQCPLKKVRIHSSCRKDVATKIVKADLKEVLTHSPDDCVEAFV